MKNVIIKMNQMHGYHDLTTIFSFELAVLEEMLVDDEKSNVMKSLKTTFLMGHFGALKYKPT